MIYSYTNPGYNYLDNLTGKTPPKQRVKTAEQARSILYELIEDDQTSSYRRAQIQGIIDGNSPYNEQQLEELGMAECVNVNWGHAEGKVDNGCIPYFDMLTSVPTYATVRTAYGKNEKKKTEWSRIITDEFYRLQRGDKGFLKNHQRNQKNIVVQGTSCMHFRGTRDWRSRAVDPWNMIVPRSASAEWTSWEFCFVLDEMYAVELWEKIENPDVAERNGWDQEETRQSIMEAKIDEQDQRRPWEWYQKELKNNGLYYSYARSKIIKVAHLYVREFTGKISHYVFDRLNANGWLCKRQNIFPGFNNAFSVFLSGIGNGYFHGVRGLGQKVFKYGDAMNRTLCTMLEGVRLASSMMFKARSGSDVQKVQSVEIGPYRILPDALEKFDFNMGPGLASAMQVMQFFLGQEADQISSFLPTIVNDGHKKKGSKEVEAELGEKAKLSNTRAEMYLQDQDIHFEEQYRRAANPNLLPEDPGGAAALDFQNRCKARGVPAAALIDIESVSATRSIGQGSAAARAQGLAGVSQFLPQLPKKKRDAVINAQIANFTGGQRGVELFGIEDEEQQLSGGQASIASLENNAFMQGGQVVVDPEEDFFIHLSIHLKFFGEVVQAVQEQKMDPRMAYKAFSVGGPHMMYELQFLQQDPTQKQQFEELNQQMSDLMKIADQIAKMAEAADEREQQPPPEQTPEWAVAENRIRLDNRKAENDLMLRTAKVKQALLLKDKQTAQKLQLNLANAVSKQHERRYAMQSE